MKNITKRILFVLIIFIIILSISTTVFGWSEVIQKGQDFVKTGENAGDATTIDTDKVNSKLQDLSGYLYNLLLTAGVVIAVIVATVLGIQFMMGGAEGQAKVKEMLIPFVVGCIVVFGGFGIWKIAITVGEKLETVQTPTQEAAGGIGEGAGGAFDAGKDALDKAKEDIAGGLEAGGKALEDALDKAKTK